MSRPKRYQIQATDDRVKPYLPETDDLDEAMIATATMPVQVWDTEFERFVSPVKDDLEYHELLYRVNAKRRGKIKLRWGNIAVALAALGILSYCIYVIVTTPEPLL